MKDFITFLVILHLGLVPAKFALENTNKVLLEELEWGAERQQYLIDIMVARDLEALGTLARKIQF